MDKNTLMHLDIVESLRTIQDVDLFVRDIDTLSQMLFDLEAKDTSLKQALDLISTESAAKITKLFWEKQLDTNDRTAVTEFLKTLKTSIGQLKIIKLVLAFDPTRKTIENIHKFVEKNIEKGYIFDIEVSEDILGGTIIMFNGKYNDFSLKKSIEDVFKNKREEILKRN